MGLYMCKMSSWDKYNFKTGFYFRNSDYLYYTFSKIRENLIVLILYFIFHKSKKIFLMIEIYESLLQGSLFTKIRDQTNRKMPMMFSNFRVYGTFKERIGKHPVRSEDLLELIIKTF